MKSRSLITNATLSDRPDLGEGASVGLALAHDSAARHVRGTAAYIDDMPEPAGTVHVAPGCAASARGVIHSMDLDAVCASPGVLAVLTAADIPGANDCSPAFGDDPILAAGEILFHGQVVFAVVAETRDVARRAARRARIEVDSVAPRITVEDGLAAGAEVLAPYEFRRGEPAPAIDSAANRLEGGVRIGGQEHFYLEGQAALAVPGEDDEMRVYSSTQHPSEVQNLVAHMLGVPGAAVVCECRRMGGAFGGKESQAAQWACLAALAAHAIGRPAKLRLDRDDDMVMTGKRHDFRVDWRCGFDGDGVLEGVDVELNVMDLNTMIGLFNAHKLNPMAAYYMDNPYDPVSVLNYTFISDHPWAIATVHAPDEGYEAEVVAMNEAATADERRRMIRDLDRYIIEQFWAVQLPNIPLYNATSPWVKGYNGEIELDSCGGRWQPFARSWVDQDLKVEMGR